MPVQTRTLPSRRSVAVDPEPRDGPSARRRLGRNVGAAVGLLAAVGALAVYLVAPLNGNLRYELGVKIVSTHSAAATFSHRPLAFRLLLDAVRRLADVVAFGLTSFELAVRLIVLGLAVGAGVLLGAGLRRQQVAGAWAYALVATGAVVGMGTTFTAEPDWMAPLLVAGGIGAALLGRERTGRERTGRERTGRERTGRVGRGWLWSCLSGVLLVAAGAMKIVSLPLAVAGLLVVGAVDHRRLGRTLVACLVVGSLYVAATVLWVPWEIRWLLDIRNVQPAAGARLVEAGSFFLTAAERWPTIALLPAALVLARPRERAVLLAVLVLVVVPIVGQGQYFGYHAAGLCMVSAVAVFRMLRGRVTPWVGGAALAATLGATTVLAGRTVSGWQDDHRGVLAAAAVAVAGAAVIWAVRVRRRVRSGSPTVTVVAALTTLALLVPSTTPFAALLVRLPAPGRPALVQGVGDSSAAEEQVGRRVRERIGARTEVTYLTFGSWTYFVRNPTRCRYPSPLFLQRTRYSTAPVGTASYAENLACLSTPGSRWLVWDPAWFTTRHAPADLRAALAREWDCSHAEQVGPLRLCPRR